MESRVNRTGIVTDIHPCYKIEDFSYILTSRPSIICILLYTSLALLCLVTIFGNLLVIISIIYFKQLHTPTNYLILSLAVADLLVGVIVFPLSMAFSLSSCLYHEHFFYRYYAVCQPLMYRTKINDHVVTIMIVVSWAVSALIGIGVIIAGLNNGKCEERCLIDVLMENTIGPILSFYLPVIIMLCIYFKIFLVALKQARSIQNTKSGGTASKTERKATKTLAIVLGVFLICWSPFFICITFMPFTQHSVPLPLIETLNWLTLSNSMLNPFIYAFFYSWFRSAFRMIICGKIFKAISAGSTSMDSQQSANPDLASLTQTSCCKLSDHFHIRPLTVSHLLPQAVAFFSSSGL
ncbi:trace amine-associated receptor 1-like [Sphaeramia orbicularis]|uniref:trace amine-associated receptor 1-like n=1 Tax=Sphaeramia orbicularis TaxID=375764 RepID=UPI0011811790|nr:trace amine-associated receptor 1-like [Sphaeramia orbicularis]